MLRTALLGVLLLIGLVLKAQPDTLRVSRLKERIPLYNKAIFTYSTLSFRPDTLQKDITAQLDNWQSLRSKPKTYAQRAHWLRFVVNNDTDTTHTLFVYLTNLNQSVTFYIAQKGHLEIKQGGTMIPTSRWAYPKSDVYISFNIERGQTAVVLARAAHHQGILPFWTNFQSPTPSLDFWVYKETDFYRSIARGYDNNMPEFQYRSWIQGALALVVLFVGVLYWKYRQRIYVYYWIYVFCGFLFSLFKTRSYTPIGQWLGEWPLLKTHLMEGLLSWGVGAYLLFMIELLDLAQKHPTMQRWFKRLSIVLISYGFLYMAIILSTNDLGFQQFSFWWGRVVALPIYGATLFWISRSVKSPMVRYVVWANIVLGFFGVLAWLRAAGILLKGVKLPGNVDDLLTLSFAVVMEILVLSLAIAHRFRLIEKENADNQLAYFIELQNKSMYEKRMAETEMQALRSQMNPHFLFNSLNSLEYLIMSNDEPKATGYLAKFSKLLRMILNHSREESITLEEELMALRYYLDIEAMRLGDDFKYMIQVEKNVDPERVVIPPLLLQPFVENAIWHGLMPSEQVNKMLIVRIRSVGSERIEFEIEDNGIGRKKAAEMRSRSTVKRKSYGMDITQQRIELFNKNYPSQLSIEVFDLQNDRQTGTLVKIGYKMKEK
ncbi:MAG: histidine kinase [Spirosomataceae bacterium]